MKICGYLGECPYFQNAYLIHSGKCNRVTCLSLTILNSSGKNVYLNNVLCSLVSTIKSYQRRGNHNWEKAFLRLPCQQVCEVPSNDWCGRAHFTGSGWSYPWTGGPGCNKKAGQTSHGQQVSMHYSPWPLH